MGGRWAPHEGLSLGGGTVVDSHLWLETRFTLVPLSVGTRDFVTAAKIQAGSPCMRWVLGFEVSGLEAFARIGYLSMDTCGLERGPLFLLEIRIRSLEGSPCLLVSAHGRVRPVVGSLNQITVGGGFTTRHLDWIWM